MMMKGGRGGWMDWEADARSKQGRAEWRAPRGGELANNIDGEMMQQDVLE